MADGTPPLRDTQGLKYLDQLLPLLERLHDVGCRRDKAGNRKLHYDQDCRLVLLFLFNPTLRSLRALQQAGRLKKVQRKLGCPRTSLGSLSEATDVFDPRRLEGILGELSTQVPARGNVGRGAVPGVLTALAGLTWTNLTAHPESLPPHVVG